jgi:hypothetical protein
MAFFSPPMEPLPQGRSEPGSDPEPESLALNEPVAEEHFDKLAG